MNWKAFGMVLWLLWQLACIGFATWAAWRRDFALAAFWIALATWLRVGQMDARLIRLAGGARRPKINP